MKRQLNYITEVFEKSGGSYNPSMKELLLSKADKIVLAELGIDFEQTGEGVSIRLGTPNFPLYFNEEVFLRDFRLQNLDSDFGLIQEHLYYEMASARCYKDNVVTSYENVISQTIIYLRIKELLSDTNTIDCFANYVDNARRKMVIISSVKGTMVIGFPNITPKLNDVADLELVYQKLTNSITAKGFMALFRSEVYDNLKNENEEDRFIYLVKRLKLILENSERNFEVYLSNFSFDELKDKLTAERVKYFNSTREILGKVYTQITSVPIAISAAAFSTYKVDNRITLVLIFAGFGIYAVFVNKLLLALKNETSIVESDFNSEKEKIVANSKLEKPQIEVEMNNIKVRIDDVKTTIKYFTRVFVSLCVLFLLFIVYQWLYPNTTTKENPMIIIPMDIPHFNPLKYLLAWEM